MIYRFITYVINYILEKVSNQIVIQNVYSNSIDSMYYYTVISCILNKRKMLWRKTSHKQDVNSIICLFQLKSIFKIIAHKYQLAFFYICRVKNMVFTCYSHITEPVQYHTLTKKKILFNLSKSMLLITNSDWYENVPCITIFDY